jgi:hypothetical protein
VASPTKTEYLDKVQILLPAFARVTELLHGRGKMPLTALERLLDRQAPTRRLTQAVLDFDLADTLRTATLQAKKKVSKDCSKNRCQQPVVQKSASADARVHSSQPSASQRTRQCRHQGLHACHRCLSSSSALR